MMKLVQILSSLVVLIILTAANIVEHPVKVVKEVDKKESIDSEDSITYRFRRQLQIFPQEKIYLHTDRSRYQAGDTIWLRAHLVDAATHRATFISRYVYVELIDIDAKLLKRIKLRPDEKNVFHGYIPIQEDQPQGYYSLRAYTRFMENLPENYFFHSDIAIVNPKGRKTSKEDAKEKGKHDTLVYRPPFHVTFFPEGGYLPVGVHWRVAFKGVGTDGWSDEVHGIVVEKQSGDTVATVKHSHRGMGTFMMTAEKGKVYVARLLNGQNRYLEFELPEAEENVPMLSAHWVKNRLGVTLSHPKQEGLRLVMHTRGMVFYNRPWNTDHPVLFINKQQLPGGVIQLLLVDEEENVLSERLVFNREAQELQTTLNTDKQEYGLREKVEIEALLDRETTDSLGLGNFSASVCFSEDEASTSPSSIYTYLLLSSEVKGNIELPETYFKENTKESEQNLDLLMLTQGWRRYDISKLTQGSLKQPDTKPEIGQEIHGQVVSEYSGKPFEKAPVLMIIQGARFYEEKETDSLGRFSFTHLEFPDSTRYILRGLSHKNKSKDVLTKVQEDFFPKIYKHKGIYTLLNRPTVKKELDINVLNDSTIRLIELGEVEITASFKQPRVPSFGFVSRAYTTTLDEKFYKKKQVYDMVDLLNTTPFVTCMGDAIYVRYSPTMRKGSRMGLEAAAPPLMMIDDIRSDIYQVLSLNPEDIEEVSVVRKTLGTIYELEASSLLLIYTKPHIKRVDRFAKVNIAGHTPLGYQLPAEFYSPKYVAEVKGKNDNRHTLHWQPNVAVDQEGKSSFNFYTGDKTGNYTVVVQGVTHDGEIIHAKKQFKVVENEE